MSDQKKIDKDWENFRKSKEGKAQQESVDESWKNFTTAQKKLRIISDDEAQKIIKEKSKIMEEGTEEMKLSEMVPLVTSKDKRGRMTAHGKKYARAQIDYSIRLIQSHEILVAKKNFSLNVPPLKPGALPRGLELAVLDMKLNESRSIILPPELAFGNKEIPGIPPYSTVEFEIKLLKYDFGQIF